MNDFHKIKGWDAFKESFPTLGAVFEMTHNDDEVK